MDTRSSRRRPVGPVGPQRAQRPQRPVRPLSVVVYNAHFAERYGAASLTERNEQCIAAFMSMPLAASTIFFVQEAGLYLAHIAKLAFTTHLVSYTPTDGRMALLTLVPRALVQEGAYVTTHDLRNSAMARQFHAVHVRDMVLVNTHLESCAASRAVRGAQVDEINAMYGGGEYRLGVRHRLGIFGDLNGYHNHWDSPIPGGTEVHVLEKRTYASISPHKLLVLSVA